MSKHPHTGTGWSDWTKAEETYAKLREGETQRAAHGDPFAGAIDRLTANDDVIDKRNEPDQADALEAARIVISDVLFELSFELSTMGPSRKCIVKVRNWLNEWADKYGLDKYDWTGRTYGDKED